MSGAEVVEHIAAATAPNDSEAESPDAVALHDVPAAPSYAFVSNADETLANSNPTIGPGRLSLTSDTLNSQSTSANGTGSTTPVSRQDIQTALSTSLAPKSGVLPSQHASRLSEQDQMNDSDLDFKISAPVNPPDSRPMGPAPPPQQSFYSTFRMDPQTKATVQREPKTSVRRVKEYTLPDGTVVSGKGLGRGRPGIKRGPRTPKHSLDEAANASSSPATATPGVPTAIKAPISRKRKQVDSDISESVSATPSSRESSPEYNPTGATRSGRITHKPSTLTRQPSSSNVASPASTAKRPKLESHTSPPTISPSTLKQHPKIKRRIYRGREQLALCEHCLRGHGPVGNVIVFCDACNNCWHQRCHDPQIPQSIVSDKHAEWFCANCDRILHGRKGAKAKLIAAKAAAAAPAKPAQPTFSGPLLPGTALTRPQKLAYLQSLAKDQLITAILSASDLAPALPLFQAAAPVLPLAQFTSSYTTPTASTPNYNYNNTRGAAEGTSTTNGEAEDEGYDGFFDEQVLLYPKIGHGIKLPPEKDDLTMLLEGRNCTTFSHWVRQPGIIYGLGSEKEYSGSADVSRSWDGER